MGREGHGDKPPAQEASKDLTFKAGSTPEDFTLRTLFFFFSFTKEPVLVDMEEPVWEQEPALPAPGLCRSPGSKVGWRPAGPRPYLYPQPWAGRGCCPLTGAGGSGLTLLDVRKLVGGNQGWRPGGSAAVALRRGVVRLTV